VWLRDNPRNPGTKVGHSSGPSRRERRVALSVVGAVHHCGVRERVGFRASPSGRWRLLNDDNAGKPDGIDPEIGCGPHTAIGSSTGGRTLPTFVFAWPRHVVVEKGDLDICCGCPAGHPVSLVRRGADEAQQFDFRF
jgi:hypothetical protein